MVNRSIIESPSGRPAILGGGPAFPDGLPLVRPALPDPERVVEGVREVLASGLLTNGPKVRQLEAAATRYLGVRHCVAVSSCTSGLMLLLRAAALTGEVVLPSFTFAATAHAIAWNGLRPVFADVDEETLTLSPMAVVRALGVRTSAILGTHTFGTPCDAEALADVARSHGIRLFFDAAHAFGSWHGDRPIGGFGDGEVFSLTPTKVLVGGEGGIIATNDDWLAERCRIGRDYGNPGDYNCVFVGLNARMSEFHAVVALESLSGLEERIQRRNDLVARYRQALDDIPGVAYPAVRPGDRSTYKDFTILIDPDAFGMDAAAVARALEAEGIETRRYYAPPVHEMHAYRALASTSGNLKITERISSRVLTLPFWIDLTDQEVAGVANALRRVQRFAGERSEGSAG